MSDTSSQYPLVNGETCFDAVILCDGDYPTHPVPLAILRRARFVCCCDGAGLNHIINHGGHADAIVGDGDSLPADFKSQYAGIINIVSEQEDNDQTKATRFCLARGFRRIAYLGSTGKREDHTLGNMSLMLRYMRQFDIQPTMITDHGYFTPCHGDTVMESFPCQQVSIFNFGCSQLQGSGLRWNTYPYQELWQGTLNEATAGTISFHADGHYLVFRTFDPK